MPLGSGIVENAWYRLNLQVLTARGLDDSLSVGACGATRTPRTPTATWTARSAASLLFNGSLSDVGLEQDGFVGMAAWAESARRQYEHDQLLCSDRLHLVAGPGFTGVLLVFEAIGVGAT